MIKKNGVLKLIGILLLAGAAVFTMLPAERAGMDASRWMEGLADDLPLNRVSLPGTHDSGALHSLADAAGKCQSVTVEEQLAMGVRFFDIRLRVQGDRLDVVHSFVDQKTDFRDIMTSFSDFLAENPSEFLVLSLKEDADPVRPAGTFAECAEAVLSDFAEQMVPGLPGTVGDARGKLCVLARYRRASLGIPAAEGWQDSASFAMGGIYVQDHYAVSGTDVKKEDIRNALAVSDAGEYGLVLNFASCYLTGGFPPMYAAEPAKIINPWLAGELAERKVCTGVLICDFMTSELAGAIIGTNFS